MIESNTLMCAAEDCSNIFVPMRRGRRRVYCSTTCYNRIYKRKQRKAAGAAKVVGRRVQCATQGCTTMVVTPTTRGRPRKFCSDACRQKDFRERRKQKLVMLTEYHESRREEYENAVLPVSGGSAWPSGGIGE